MATSQSHFKFSLCNNPKLIHLKNPHSFTFSKKILVPRKPFLAKKFDGLLSSRFIGYAVASSSSSSGEIEESVVASEIEDERPPFDINLAVILAGFAFEAYATPPVNSSCPLIPAIFLFFLLFMMGKWDFFFFLHKVVLLVGG